MRRLALIAMLAVLWAGGAAAQGVVRSGEHGDFARLVMPIGTGRSFEITGEGAERRILFTPEISLDISAVFERIARDRLGAIAADGGLTLTLACRCEVRAYRYEGRYLVIDITDPVDPPPEPAAETPPQPDPLPAAASSGRPDPPPAEPVTMGMRQPATPPPFRLSELGFGGSPILPELAPIMPPREEPGADENDAPAPPAPDLDATAEALAEQIARAASAGLLNPAPLQPMTAADPPESSAENGGHAPTEPIDHSRAPDGPAAGPDPATAPGALPVRSANAFDVVLDRDTGLAGAATALTCSDRIGDVNDWADGLGFDQGLGALRRQVIDARGEVVGPAAVRLARYYIYHGFGAEAEHWLTAMEDPPETELAMARYLDGRPGPNFTPVETLALCTGQDLLWRFVDAEDFPPLSRRQRQEMHLAFAGLPTGLQRLLGPDLVRDLDAAGYEADAVDLREALFRGETLDAAEELLLELETSEGPVPEGSAERLTETLRQDGPDAPRAMARYLALTRRNGTVPEPGRLIAAEAMLRESAADHAPGGLWHEVLLARIAAGDDTRLFEMLDETATDPEATRAALAESAVEAVLATGRMAPLAILAARLADTAEGAALPSGLRRRIATTLRAEGLDELAQPFAPAGPQPAAPDRLSSGNWAAAAGETEGAAAVAARLSALRSGHRPEIDPETPETVRAAIADSRALRAELSQLLGADN